MFLLHKFPLSIFNTNLVTLRNLLAVCSSQPKGAREKFQDFQISNVFSPPWALYLVQDFYITFTFYRENIFETCSQKVKKLGGI